MGQCKFTVPRLIGTVDWYSPCLRLTLGTVKTGCGRRRTTRHGGKSAETAWPILRENGWRGWTGYGSGGRQSFPSRSQCGVRVVSGGKRLALLPRIQAELCTQRWPWVGWRDDLASLTVCNCCALLHGCCKGVVILAAPCRADTKKGAQKLLFFMGSQAGCDQLCGAMAVTALASVVSTRRAPLKRLAQYELSMLSMRTLAPVRGAWMNLPSPT